MKVGEVPHGVCMWDIVDPHLFAPCVRAKAYGSCLLIVECSYEGRGGGGTGWAWERKFTIKTEDLSFYPTYVAFSN